MAAKLEIGERAYRDIESGKSELSVRRIFLIGRILEVPIKVFMNDENAELYEKLVVPISEFMDVELSTEKKIEPNSFEAFNISLKAKDETIKAKDEIIALLRAKK